MNSWAGWPLERFLYVFIGAAFLLVWLQASLYHWRGGFHNKFMWGPVLYTPLLVVAALSLAATPSAAMFFVAVYAIGVLEGLAGTVLHLQGITRMVGGFNVRNVMAGPPFLLPLIYMCLALLGLLIHYWPQLSGGAAAAV